MSLQFILNLPSLDHRNLPDFMFHSILIIFICTRRDFWKVNAKNESLNKNRIWCSVTSDLSATSVDVVKAGFVVTMAATDVTN
jgi:hypothetical protein